MADDWDLLLPYTAHQTANAAVVFQVIEAIEDKEIDGVLEGLDPSVMDLLMKYVYKGLSVRAVVLMPTPRPPATTTPPGHLTPVGSQPLPTTCTRRRRRTRTHF